MSKYKALNEFLIASGEKTIAITFDEIANIINTNLLGGRITSQTVLLPGPGLMQDTRHGM